MDIKAKNPKNQSKVNKAVKYLTAYYQANTKRDHAEDEGNKTEFKKYDKICANTFDKYLEALEELPKGEQTNIEKQYHK